MKFIQIFLLPFLVACQSTPVEIKAPPNVDAQVEFHLSSKKVHKFSEKAIKPIVLVQPKTNTTGWVYLQYKISKKGGVRNIKVIDASPKGSGIEKAAINSLRKWKYNPALAQQTKILFQFR